MTLPVANTGSSPRLRGTLGRGKSQQCQQRFIPASAGNTAEHVADQREVAVHPRVCGEHRLASVLRSVWSGSSPRLRGTHLVVRGGVVDQRFIPASAGNTRMPSPRQTARTVHPRVCGEHLLLLFHDGLYVGSSPRLRGTLSPVLLIIPWLRFIPASAGNTSGASVIMVR